MRERSKLMYVFSLPRFGNALLMGIVGFATFNLYTVGYQVPEFLVGSAISIGYVSIALSQFFFGWISDRWFIPRLGKRKPWVLILTPIGVISFIAIMLPGLFLQSPDETSLFIWLLVWDVLFEMAYAATTPYGAWMAETFTADERPKTSQLQSIFNFIGYGVMTVFTMIVLTGFTDKLEADPGAVPPEYIFAIFLFAIIYFTLAYLCALLMPTEAPPKVKPNLVRNLKNIFRNKNYMFVVFMQGFASLAWITTATVMLNYVQIVLAFGTLQYILAGVTLILGIFVFLSIWKKIIKKRGKKWGLLRLFLIAAAILSCSLLGLIPTSSTVVFGLLFILGIACSLGGWYLISGIWFADLAEDDAKRTEEMKAGLYVGFPSIPLNLFQALGTFILGVVTSLPDILVGSLTFSIGYVLWGPICAAFLIWTYFYSKRFIQLDYAWEKEPKREIVEQKS